MTVQQEFICFNDRIKLSRLDEAYTQARTKDNSITSAIKEAFKEEGYKVIDDFLQGSLSIDTGILKKDGDFDIDRALVIDTDDAPDNPVDPKKVVLRVLEKRGFKNAKIKKPCITADYLSENLHIDFTVYRRSGGSVYQLAVGKYGSDEQNREWSDSDPKGLKIWIKDKSNYGASSDL
ncbi:nucleotidyltransferase, partial [Nitrincola sp.]|uniref:nucleotidyltransferase domain-containing protein n=1 Tax=Nitrincola sp. TaxID=1926584 RepID=UPI003A93EBF8